MPTRFATRRLNCRNSGACLRRAGAYEGPMPRKPIAVLAGLIFITLWVAGATILADHVHGRNRVVQFLYFGTAGFVWVFPVRWLMLWAVHQR